MLRCLEVFLLARCSAASSRGKVTLEVLFTVEICLLSLTQNYTSVDPKQFTVSKFRLKPVILISECFCSRCGHTNQHPPPTWRETTGDNGRQDHFRAQEGGHTNQHPPPTWRETTGEGDKTTSEPKKAATPTNTPTPHMKRDNRRQRETRPLQSPRSRPHQPTPRRPDLKLH